MQSQVHGGDIYSAEYQLDFSTSISPLGIPEGVKKAYLEAAGTIGQYPDVRSRALRSALSISLSVPEDWIVCSSGAAEMIFAVANAARPKRALLPVPSFSEYEAALRLSGCSDIRFYEEREELGFLIREDILDDITDEIGRAHV